jgi:hypothetical protein
MENSSLLSATVELSRRVIVPFLLGRSDWPGGNEIVAKFHMADDCAQKLLAVDEKIIESCTDKEIATRFSRFVDRMRHVELRLSEINDRAVDHDLTNSIQECATSIDDVLDDLEVVRAVCIYASFKGEMDKEQSPREQAFKFYPEACQLVESMIGNGSFGYTHRMTCAIDGGLYAVKRVDLKRLTMMGVSTGRLEDEYATLLSLSHPHIARYFPNLYSGGGETFNMVSELIEGMSLAEKVGAAPASTEVEITEWARQMASALSYMHKHGLLHRDLRLDNVLLSDRSRVKICDVKPACAMAFSAAFGRAGQDVYSSYEKLYGEPYDGRDDIYAAGIILLALLLRTR